MVVSNERCKKKRIKGLISQISWLLYMSVPHRKITPLAWSRGSPGADQKIQWSYGQTTPWNHRGSSDKNAQSALEVGSLAESSTLLFREIRNGFCKSEAYRSLPEKICWRCDVIASFCLKPWRMFLYSCQTIITLCSCLTPKIDYFDLREKKKWFHQSYF